MEILGRGEPGPSVKWQDQFVNSIELNETYHIATRDPTVYASIEYYFRFLKLTDVELVGTTAEYRQTWFRKYIKGKLPDILFHLVVHGYCGYVKDYRKFDGSRDEDWMKRNRALRDESGEGYDIKQPVIIVPDYDAYTHKLRKNMRTLEHEVFGTNEATGDEFAGANAMRYKRRVKPIEMITVSKYKIPFFNTGRLRTPLATLISAFAELRQMEMFNVTACYQLSHPIPFIGYQTGMKDEELLSRVKSVAFGDSMLNQAKDKEIYFIFQEGNKTLEEEVNKTNDAMAGEMKKEKAYYIDPINPNSVVKLSHVMDRRVNLPPGKEISKANPPIAVVPAGLQEMYHRWTEKVSNVFSLPYSLLSKDKIGGGNAGKQYADADLKMLQKTIADLTVVMEDVFEHLYDILEMDPSEKFVLHAQPFVDFEMLLACYDHMLIDKQQLQTEIEDSYALKRNKNSVNTSATYEMLDAMKKNEAIGPGEYKRGMKKIYNLDLSNDE